VPDMTLWGAAANPRTQRLVLVALGMGSVLLLPSLGVLYRVFKAKAARAPASASAPPAPR
jgi:cytochrome d ubiquinol oxidase subunit II